MPTKLRIAGRWAIGGAGASRFCLLARRLDLDALPDAQDVADALREAIKADGGRSFQRDGQAPEYAAEFLAVDRRDGSIHRIDDSFASTPEPDFAACGSGEQFAIGAMWEAHRAGRSAEQLVQAGLHAACDLSSGCGMGTEVERVWSAAEPLPAILPARRRHPGSRPEFQEWLT